MSSTKVVRDYLTSLIIQPEKVFAGLALLFGVMFVLLMPPFQNPDEFAHVLRAYQVSDFHITGNFENNSAVDNIPKSIIDSAHLNETAANGKILPGHPENKYNRSAFKESLKSKLDRDTVVKAEFTASQRYSPVPYIPQVLGILCVKFFNPPVLVILYSARLASLFTFVLLVFFSIKIIPRRKWAIAAIALLPVSLIGAASATSDTLLLASFVMALSLFSQAYEARQINHKKLALLTLLLIAITLSKQIYGIILILLITLPFATKNKRLRMIYISCTTALCAGLYVLWESVNPASKAGVAYSAGGADPQRQLSYIFSGPLVLIKLMYNTFATAKGNVIYESLFGKFGWLDTPLPLIGMACVFGLLVFVVFCSYEDNRHVFERLNWFIASVSLLIFGATCGALYLAWTRVGLSYIDGLQGRYFLPIVYLLSILYLGKFAIKVSKKYYSTVITIASPLLLSLSSIVIYCRYYR